MFGERVIGAEAAAKAAREGNNGAGGGAIQFGERVTGGVMTVDAPPAPKARPKPQSASKNRVPKKEAGGVTASKSDVQAAYTELEIERMLGEDPNLWKRVLDAETARELPRPAVAKMILNVADLATEPAIPTVLIAELTRIAAAKPLTAAE